MIIDKMKNYSKKYTNLIYKKIKNIRQKRSNINIFLTTVARVMIWRWVWELLDLYLFPNNHKVSIIVGIIIWIFLLFVDNEKLDEIDHK